MKKFDKYFNATNNFIVSIILIVLGIILIALNEKFYTLIIDIFIYFVLIVGIKNFIGYFYNYKGGKVFNKKFFRCLINLLFALVLSCIKVIPLALTPMVVGIYFIINFILQLIDFIIIIQTNDKGVFSKMLISLFYLVIGIYLIIFPLKNLKLLLITIGIYFILLGLSFLTECILNIIPIKYKNIFKSKIRINLPVFIECLIPYGVLNEINELLKAEEDFQYEDKKNDDNPDIEVFVHVSNNGFNRMGHVDICFEGEVISYGNYDIKSLRYRDMFGNGVIFITERNKYINFCIEHSKKTLFVYGLKLKKQEKEKIRKEINDIKANLIEWYPPILEDKKNKNKKSVSKDYKDYSSCLYKKTKAKFYKLKKGKYKTYFVLGNNCCSLVNKILGKGGLDLLKLNGLITPGTYYEYLNREFMRKKSIVVSRNIYNYQRKSDVK